MKADSSISDLFPCPFCGCSPKYIPSDMDDESAHVVNCPDCPCLMIFSSSTKEQTIERWNTRTPSTKDIIHGMELAMEIAKQTGCKYCNCEVGVPKAIQTAIQKLEEQG